MINREKIIKTNQDLWPCLKQKKIFLTGGTGFFGKSFLDLFNFLNKELKFQSKITILTRNSDSFKSDYPEFAGLDFISFFQGDICDFTFPEDQYDYILHFATPASATLNQEQPQDIYNIITKGTERVLEFAKKCQAKKILFASSGAVYGVQPWATTYIEESYVANLSQTIGYGAGKHAAETMGVLAAEKNSFEFKIARCFAFIGSYLDPQGTYAIGNFVRDAVLSKNIIVRGDGRDVRSYMSADDLIVALLKILINGKNKVAYNVGSDETMTIKELATTIKSLVNPKIKVEILGKINESVSPNRYVPNIDLLKSELKYIPSVTFSDSVLEMAKYYKKKLSK